MPRLTVKEYAALSARLAHISASAGGASDANAHGTSAALAQALHQTGVTADEWDAESSYWEDELSQALDRDEDVPQLVLDYSTAIQAAQNALAGVPLALEAFSQILGEVQRGAPLDQVLRQRHISLAEFLSAQRHWMVRAAAEPDVRLALEAALR
jgi:hypothetical protein